MSAWTAWDEPRLATLKKHLDDGLSISQAGTRMGVSYQAVSRAMDARGLKRSDAAGFWTSEERVAFLKADFVAGLSCGQIAKRLTATFKSPVSRNAVIGKLSRLGLSDPSRVGATKKVSVGRIANAKPPRVSPPPAAEAPERPMGKDHGLTATATLATLKAHGCKWPIGDPRDADFGFCGLAREHHAYCEAHRKIAYQPEKVRQYVAGVTRKDECRARAATMWPRHSDLFARKKDDGRAEAALLAVYGRRQIYAEAA